MNEEQDITPCLVVGTGVAGIAAALWLHGLSTPFIWLGRTGGFGGILSRVNNPIHNYPGGHFDDGRDLIEHLKKQVDELPHALLTRNVVSIERDGPTVPFRVECESGECFHARAVILATGTRYRRLGIPGELELMGRVVSQSANQDGEHYAGKDVAVVGGGDAGFENALILAEKFECHIKLMLRSEEIRAREDFATRVREHPRIEICPIPTQVEEVEEVEGRARLTLSVQGESKTLDVACLFVRIGVEPVHPLLEPDPERDHGGFVAFDRDQQTNISGLFVAGDLGADRVRAVATAAGQGVRAAQSASEWLGRFGSGRPGPEPTVEKTEN